MLRKMVLVALICAARQALAASDSRVKIAVLDLQARGVDKALVESAGTLIAIAGSLAKIGDTLVLSHFRVAGDDPHKYEGFRETAPEPATKASLPVGAGPAEGGAQLSFAGRF